MCKSILWNSNQVTAKTVKRNRNQYRVEIKSLGKWRPYLLCCSFLFDLLITCVEGADFPTKWAGRSNEMSSPVPHWSSDFSAMSAPRTGRHQKLDRTEFLDRMRCWSDVTIRTLLIHRQWTHDLMIMAKVANGEQESGNRRWCHKSSNSGILYILM